jgi:hypothetical protein
MSRYRLKFKQFKMEPIKSQSSALFEIETMESQPSASFKPETWKSQSSAPQLIVPYILNTDEYNGKSFSVPCPDQTKKKWAVSLEPAIQVEEEEIIVQFPAYERRIQANRVLYDPEKQLHKDIFESDNRPPFYETKEEYKYFRPINSVWMDKLKDDEHTEWIILKPRFQIQEPDFSSRIKGTLIKQEPTPKITKNQPTPKKEKKKITKLLPGQRSILDYIKPSNQDFEESFEKDSGIKVKVVKGPIEETGLDDSTLDDLED